MFPNGHIGSSFLALSCKRRRNVLSWLLSAHISYVSCISYHEQWIIHLQKPCRRSVLWCIHTLNNTEHDTETESGNKCWGPSVFGRKSLYLNGTHALFKCYSKTKMWVFAQIALILFFCFLCSLKFRFYNYSCGAVTMGKEWGMFLNGFEIKRQEKYPLWTHAEPAAFSIGSEFHPKLWFHNWIHGELLFKLATHVQARDEREETYS